MQVKTAMSRTVAGGTSRNELHSMMARHLLRLLAVKQKTPSSAGAGGRLQTSIMGRQQPNQVVHQSLWPCPWVSLSTVANGAPERA